MKCKLEEEEEGWKRSGYWKAKREKRWNKKMKMESEREEM